MALEPEEVFPFALGTHLRVLLRLAHREPCLHIAHGLLQVVVRHAELLCALEAAEAFVYLFEQGAAVLQFLGHLLDVMVLGQLAGLRFVRIVHQHAQPLGQRLERFVRVLVRIFRHGVRRVDDNLRLALDDALFQCDGDGLLDELVQQVAVLEPLAAEHRQQGRTYRHLLWGHVQEVLESQVRDSPFDQIRVGEARVDLQEQVLEQDHRVHRDAAVIVAVLVLELVAHERKVYAVAYLAEHVILGDEQVVELRMVAELDFILFLKHVSLCLIYAAKILKISELTKQNQKKNTFFSEKEQVTDLATVACFSPRVGDTASQ